MDIKSLFINKLLSIIPIEYQTTKPYPHCVLEDILDKTFAKKCQKEIIELPLDMWDRYNNPFEQKFTLRDKSSFPENCKKLFDILTSQEVLDVLSNIVGEKLYNDTSKNWWGVHMYENRDYLDIHSDAGNHPITKQNKHLTLGIYLSYKWLEENRGHLELWDGESVLNNEAKLYECFNRILPSFNRMIMFTNTTNAWHGNPEPVVIHNEEKRIFVTLSYVSDKHDGVMENNREKAFFISRPGDPLNLEKDNLRLLRCDANKCSKIYNINDQNK
jgi:Rps23 Pro-64 3,4-dihydroxylase Tpa1-like proline 4-hydroxylase